MLCTTAMALVSYSEYHDSLNALIVRPFLYCSRSSGSLIAWYFGSKALIASICGNRPAGA